MRTPCDLRLPSAAIGLGLSRGVAAATARSWLRPRAHCAHASLRCGGSEPSAPCCSGVNTSRWVHAVLGCAHAILRCVHAILGCMGARPAPGGVPVV
eukprot:1636945-Prymnesium_polylepis.1